MSLFGRKRPNLARPWSRLRSPVCRSILFCCLGAAAAGPLLAPQKAMGLRTIQIGEIDPLTGKLAEHGLEIHEGILYAIEEANGRGGAGGDHVRFELVSRDDQSQPEVAINQAEELLYGVGVAGLVGGYVDSLVGPISELAAKHKTPYVASASLQTSLTAGRENPFFFRVARLDGIVGPLCSFVTEVLRPRKTAVLFASTPGSTELGQHVRSCLDRAGLSISLFEKFRPGSPDFSPFLMKARASGTEVLISGGFFTDHLILARQLKEQGVKLRAYIGPWGVAYESFIEEVGEASEGLFGMCAWGPGITMPGTESESQAFIQGFLKRFGKNPNTTTMHGYTSARAVIAAVGQVLKNGEEVNGKTISEALRSLDLLLPMERLAFEKNGDPKYYAQIVVQIQKGKLVAVYPPERATGRVVEQ